MEGPRDNCDERYSEFDKEWVAVDIVTVEEPEELLFIMASLLDSGNCIAGKKLRMISLLEMVGRDVSLGLGINQPRELAF